MSTRILLADDHKIMRDGLRALLEAQPDLKVVGETDDGRMTVEKAKELAPDLVIMDLGMPEMNGIEATKEIVAHLPNIKVLALSIHSDRQFVAGMLAAGASGYLLKDCAFEELVQGIRAVLADQIYLSPSVTRVVVEDYVRHLTSVQSPAGSLLTPREREVLALLAQDKTTKEIAAILDISDKTILTHRQQIMNKLNIHKTTGLVKYAIREGLISVKS
jgi:two-component system, NarL family, response regulator NreC